MERYNPELYSYFLVIAVGFADKSTVARFFRRTINFIFLCRTERKVRQALGSVTQLATYRLVYVPQQLPSFQP